jgi:phospholipase C
MLVPVVVFALQTLASIPAHAASPCPLNQTNPSVTVCTPTPNALVVSPVNVVAGSTDSHTVTAMQIYVDNKLVPPTVKASTINSFVVLAPGNHLITVQAWDSTGATFKTNVPVAMQPPCILNATNRTVTICSMVNGSVVSQPFHVVAAATDSTPVTSMKLLIDGANKGTISNSAILDLYVSAVPLGSHTIGVQANDSSGAFSQSIKVTVTAASQGLSNIKHIIFMAQENRSFDDYFGMLGAYRASLGLPNNIDGVNPNTTLYNKNKQPVHPYHYRTECTDELTPSWDESHLDVHGGKMDQFVITNSELPSSSDPTGTRAMGYYNQSDLPYYYAAAAQFATSDRFFSPVLANTIPNRMYLFTGTSFGNAFPVGPPGGGFTQPTIFARLDQFGVSWRYYYQGPVPSGESSAFIEQFSIFQTDFKKVVPISNWFTDVKNAATLPSVIFIERGGTIGLDEHPTNNVQTGASDVAGIINALIHSPAWADSVFILTYDEGGGLYDHVPPAREVPPDNIAPKLAPADQPGQFNQSGWRVPVIVISPWVRPNLVSHTTRDYTSILRLIEDTFNLVDTFHPPLTLRDANADNMMEFFDFSGVPPLLNPPPLPTQSTSGACNHSLQPAPGF